jgi:enoyl-CoA hydratase
MQTVSTEVRGRAVIVTIERPQARNAVDGPTARQLYDAFKALDADEALDVAILQGRGGAFCAGADLKGSPRGAATPSCAMATWGPWAAPGFAWASR